MLCHDLDNRPTMTLAREIDLRLEAERLTNVVHAPVAARQERRTELLAREPGRSLLDRIVEHLNQTSPASPSPTLTREAAF